MRDQAIVGLVNQMGHNLSQMFGGTFMKMAREIDELRAHLTAETVRREVLESILFEKSSLTGGINKEDYEKRYMAKIEDYNKQVAEQIELAKKAAEEAAGQAKEGSSDLVLPPKKTLLDATGAPIGG